MLARQAKSLTDARRRLILRDHVIELYGAPDVAE